MSQPIRVLQISHTLIKFITYPQFPESMDLLATLSIDPGLTSTCLCKLSSQILSDSSKISTKCITSSKNFLGRVLELDTNVFHTKETVNNKMVSAANFDMLLSTYLL